MVLNLHPKPHSLTHRRGLCLNDCVLSWVAQEMAGGWDLALIKGGQSSPKTVYILDRIYLNFLLVCKNPPLSWKTWDLEKVDCFEAGLALHLFCHWWSQHVWVYYLKQYLWERRKKDPTSKTLQINKSNILTFNYKLRYQSVGKRKHWRRH